MKIRDKQWAKHIFIEVLFVGNDSVFGRNDYGFENSYIINDREWELYKEPKRIEAAPAVVRNYGGGVYITSSCFDKEASINSFKDQLVKWTADWDPEEGVWYYEEEL